MKNHIFNSIWGFDTLHSECRASKYMTVISLVLPDQSEELNDSDPCMRYCQNVILDIGVTVVESSVTTRRHGGTLVK